MLRHLISSIFIFPLFAISVNASPGVLYTFQNQDINRALIELYEKKPKVWKGNELLIVAICYVLDEKYVQAELAYKEVLLNIPSNTRAIRGLGNIYFSQKKYDLAENLYLKGWQLGDLDSFSQLAITYAVQEKHNDLKTLVPELVKYKDQNLDIRNLLLAFSLNTDPPDKKTFLQVVEGLTCEEILFDAHTKKIVMLGFKMFGFDDRYKALKEKVEN